MLGKVSFFDNLIFLSARYWFPVLLYVCAQGAPASGADLGFRSNHFLVVCSGTCQARAESALRRLEDLRDLLPASLGPQWVAPRTVYVWFPRTEQEWRQITKNPAEMGFAETGGRRDWIVLNPASSNWLEVLTHEYMHIVVHASLPKLATWLEEGICEYYSTIARSAKGVVLGREPLLRKTTLDRLGAVSVPPLEGTHLSTEGYALAWAIVHQWASRADWSARLAELAADPNAWQTGRWPISSSTAIARPRESLTRIPATPVTPTALTAVETQELFTELRRTWLASGTDDWETAFLAASRLLDDGNPAAALPQLEQACANRPLKSSWWLTLALAYRELNQSEKATAAAQRALANAASTQETRAAQAFLGAGK